MRIYFFGADYPPTGGGIATYSYEWIHAVAEHSTVEYVKVLIFGNKNPRKEFPTKKITLTTLKDIGFLYAGYKVFKVFWRSTDYDVFHSLNLFPIGFWVVFWGKVFRRKTAVTFYGTDANDSKASAKTHLLKKWTLNNASQAITISNFTKNQTEKNYNFKSNVIKVIYPIVPKSLLSKNKNDINISEIKNRYNIKDSDFVVITVHRLVKRKGTDLLIEAVSKISDPSVKLIIIGDGKEKGNLIQLVNRLNLSNRVLILGKVDDIIPYYQLSHVAALTSYMIPEEGDFEGLGLVLLEAQSYGLPVIGTRSGGIPEAFEEGRTGLLVPEKDVSEITKAILNMRNDVVVYNRMKNETGNFLEKRFGRKNTVNVYLEVLKSV